MKKRDFLTLKDLTTEELNWVINRAVQLKSLQQTGQIYTPFTSKVLAMIFEKSSTRTRVSFEAGMNQLGGSAIFLSPKDTQLGRGEPVEDSARVLSRMADVIMIRTFAHENIERFASFSDVPVINALTDDFHPCQLLADMQTFLEYRGSIKGKKVAWIGDGNNMCNSYINASKQFNFNLTVACPDGYEPMQSLLTENSDRVTMTNSPEEAVKNADLVVTDVWASMGQEEEQQQRKTVFARYRVSPKLMTKAKSEALFMHCLPAHRGEEISEDMLEHKSSVVWDEAENRLHAQKALLEFLLT